MLKPFYQGKLDSFCAIYAVLNALRLTHCIRVPRAQDILNDSLCMLAKDPAQFRAFLKQETDYINLVDTILFWQRQKLPLEISNPYSPDDKPSEEELWNECANWLGPNPEKNQGRAVIMRFMRYLSSDKPPLNRHWTTVDYVKDDVLHLFDCSHEAEAILNIKKSSFVTSTARLDKDRLLYIQPQTLRFLRLPF